MVFDAGRWNLLNSRLAIVNESTAQHSLDHHDAVARTGVWLCRRSNARTPELDALAAQSVNYAQAVTPHPFGPFARAALLTGVPSPENGIRDYFDPLPSDARTIAHELAGRVMRPHFSANGIWPSAIRPRRWSARRMRKSSCHRKHGRI